MKRFFKLVFVSAALLVGFQSSASAGIFGKRDSKRSELIVTGNANRKSAAATKTSTIMEQNEGGITFTVDSDLPQPKSPLLTSEGKFVTTRILDDMGIGREDMRIVAMSFEKENLTASFARNPFFKGMIHAFSDHCPVVLGPDVIWLLISQGFAHYVNDNPEQLRSLFVDHEGKAALLVESEFDLLSQPDSVDWSGLLDSWSQQIGANTKDGVAQLMVADFSTTGPLERIVSQATLMESMKSYFEYIVMYIGCGIPYITLTGTTRDWEKVLEKARGLRKYGLDWWVDELEPILEQFVAASQGQIDLKFWQSIVRTWHPDEVRGGACSMEKPTEFDGWFLKLLPYDENGRTPEKVSKLHKMSPEITCTPFKYWIIDPKTGIKLAEFDMILHAGIVSMEQDPVTYAMTPKLGWFVRMNQTEEEIAAKLLSQNETKGSITLRVTTVPEALMSLPAIHDLSLEFTGRVTIPDWLDSKPIERLRITGSMTPQEADALKQRFPKATITRITE